MPIINAAEAARAAQAERARLRRADRERLAWELWGVECDMKRLEIRRLALLEHLAALEQEDK